MTAYVIVEIDVHDREVYAQYIEAAPAGIAAYGGRYLARGGRAETIEGDGSPKRIVLLEFPSVEQALAWGSAPELAHVRAIRYAAAATRMIVVEGIAPR